MDKHDVLRVSPLPGLGMPVLGMQYLGAGLPDALGLGAATTADLPTVDLPPVVPDPRAPLAAPEIVVRLDAILSELAVTRRLGVARGHSQRVHVEATTAALQHVAVRLADMTTAIHALHATVQAQDARDEARRVSARLRRAWAWLKGWF